MIDGARHRGWGAVFACIIVGACTPVGAPTTSRSPEPVPVPRPAPFDDPSVSSVDSAALHRPTRPVEVAPLDPILDSHFARDPLLSDRVALWIERFAVRDGHAFPTFLQRMSAYEPLVDSALAAEGLPRSLRYVPIIESGYLTSATSPASAVGLWQFMAPVARSFGMRVSALVDERRDPVKSTLAAARYLRQLDERFGSWFLALAAYNSGPGRVDGLIHEYAPLAPPGDSVFTVIFPYLPAETRDFVPKLLAVAAVAEGLQDWGLEAPEPSERYAFDEVEVPDATSFDVVAEAAGVDEEVVWALNPHIVRGLTPRGRPTSIRLPPGTGERFAEAYAAIPPDRRVTVTEHVVASGETLGGIAHRYGVGLTDLQAANPGVRARRMRIGTRLIVPTEAGAGGATRAAGGEHVVRRGESLWVIARRYGLTVSQLRRWNGLTVAAVLQPGDRLRLAG